MSNLLDYFANDFRGRCLRTFLCKVLVVCLIIYFLRKSLQEEIFPMYYSLHNWIGEQEITKLKKQLLRIQKQAQKDMDEME